MLHREATVSIPRDIPQGADLYQEVRALSGVAELFKALSDDTRSKLLYALGQRELCVREMAELTNLSPPAVSHHLRILRQLRLVATRRSGKEVFYCLRDQHILNIITAALVSARALGLVASLEPVIA